MKEKALKLLNNKKFCFACFYFVVGFEIIDLIAYFVLGEYVEALPVMFELFVAILCSVFIPILSKKGETTIVAALLAEIQAIILFTTFDDIYEELIDKSSQFYYSPNQVANIIYIVLDVILIIAYLMIFILHFVSNSKKIKTDLVFKVNRIVLGVLVLILIAEAILLLSCYTTVLSIEDFIIEILANTAGAVLFFGIISYETIEYNEKLELEIEK